MVNHVAQSQEADESLRRKLQGTLTREEIEAAFCERHRLKQVLAEAWASRLRRPRPTD